MSNLCTMKRFLLQKFVRIFTLADIFQFNDISNYVLFKRSLKFVKFTLYKMFLLPTVKLAGILGVTGTTRNHVVMHD